MTQAAEVDACDDAGWKDKLPPDPPPASNWLVVIGLFFFGAMVFAGGRLLFNPMQPLLHEAFGIGNARFGLLMTVFIAVYGLMQIPAGILADMLGARRMIIFGLLASALFTSLYSLAGSFAMLLTLRVLAGASEACYCGPQCAVASRLIPPGRRTLGFSILCCGQPVGIALALSGTSCLVYGMNLSWQAPCLIYGAATLAAGLASIRLLPRRTKSASSHARAEHAPLAPKAYAARVKALLTNRTYLALLILGFIDMAVFLMMTTWVPVFLRETKLFSSDVLTWLSSALTWTAIPAALGWAWVADRFHCRKQLLVLLFPASAGSLWLLHASDELWLVTAALMLYGATGKLGIDAILASLIADAAPEDLRSSAYGLYSAVSMAGAAVSPVCHGFLRDWTGQWQASFVLSSSLLLIGAFSVLAIFLKDRRAMEHAAKHS